MPGQKDRQPRREGCRGDRSGGITTVSDQPAPDARPTSLHKRLTVALVNAGDRARVADAIAADLGAITQGRATVVRAEDLWAAADGLAQERAEERRALRARLDAVAARAMHDCDTLKHQLDHLQGWQRTIVEGADWATTLHQDLPAQLAAVQALRDALDERRAEQRTVQQDLERVLEQRMAAATAIEEADGELAELGGSAMDESGLRRELEAAGRALRDAEAAHATALARLEELEIEATGLGVRREAAGGLPDGPEPVPAPALEAVRAALKAMQVVRIDGEADRLATDLLQAWRDLHADLSQVAGPEHGATEEDLDSARRRVAAASAALAALDAAAEASALTAEARAALDAAHAEVLAAEEEVIGRRRVSGGARRRLEAAHAAERALLEQHGFTAYLDVVLSGGRAGAADPARAGAEREHFEATVALDALERTVATSPELSHLRSERARLLGMVVDLLGVDPGDAVEELLERHRPAPKVLQTDLAEALAAAGIRPVGMSLEDAAIALLEQHPDPEGGEGGAPDDRKPQDRHVELAAIDARAADLEGDLHRAQAEVDRTAEAVQLSQRSVDAFEAELSKRADEDMQRMKRFAAAEQLRAQIDAVAATLRRAEATARQDVERADQAVAAAESAFEQGAGEISELARKARKLAEELPIDRRPEGDPLRTLEALAESLRIHAEVLQPEIDKAALAVDAASAQLEEATAACRLAGQDGDGPRTEDLVEALEGLLGGDGEGDGEGDDERDERDERDELRLLDEPFAHVSASARSRLLETVHASSAGRQIVLLTGDPEVLGWAIELPAEEAAAVPADALLTRVQRRRGTTPDKPLNPALPEADATPTPPPSAPTAAPAVDITTPKTIDTEDAPAARRWAGQR
jgi:hypothetical protein